MGDFRRRAARWLAGVFAIAAFAMAAGLMLGAPYARAAEQALTGAVTSLAAATTGGADNASVADGRAATGQTEHAPDTTTVTLTDGDSEQNGGANAPTVPAGSSVSDQPADSPGLYRFIGEVSVTGNDGYGISHYGRYAGELGFKLTSVNGAPLPVGAKEGSLVVTNGTGRYDATTVDFGSVTYSAADLEGVTVDPSTGVRTKQFSYQVTHFDSLGKVASDGSWLPEGDSSQISFDGTVKTIEVTVTEDANGVVTSKGEWTEGFKDFYFKDTEEYTTLYAWGTNWYAIESDRWDGEDGISGKYLWGESTFTVTAYDGAPTPEGVSGDTWSLRDDANPYIENELYPNPDVAPSYVHFSVPVTKNDMDGQEEKTFHYKITNQDGNGFLLGFHVTTDDSGRPIYAFSQYGGGPSVTPLEGNEADGAGIPSGETSNFSARGVPNYVPMSFEFREQYELSGEAELTGAKSVADGNREDVTSQFGGSLTFTVSARSGTPMPDGGVASEETGWQKLSVKNGAGSDARTVRFGTVHLQSAGDYTYYIKEEDSAIDGMSHDRSEKEVIITATSDAFVSAEIPKDD